MLTTAAIADDRTSSGASPPVALYVHFPFCLSICPYCDFVVYAGRAARGPTSRINTFLEALLVEVSLRGRASQLQSVYLGGGTPSLLDASDLARLLDRVDRAFGIAADAEITLEANPGPADRGDLAGFRAAGVNRLSIGVQSLRPAELRRLGRRHSPADVADTVALARRAGFDNLSLDLLYDTPGQTTDSWRRTLAGALALEPDHLSAYALSLDDPDHEGLTGAAGDHLPLRPGTRRWRTRARAEQDEDRAAACYEIADHVLSGAGLAPYELSNWSRPGRQSRHNLAYWSGLAYEALGPGGHAFDGGRTRRWNAARLDAYLAALLAGLLPPGGGERLDPATAAAEGAILRLRTAAGLPVAEVGSQSLGAGLAWGRSNGLLEEAADGGVRLTLRGRLLSNELFARLLPDQATAAAVT